VDELFAPGFVSHNMPPELPQGVDGVKGFFSIFKAAFSELEVTIDELVADGDRAAVATTTTGTHSGELMGVAPTGRRIAVTGIDMVRVDGDGRIAEHRGLTDTVGLLRQLSG
jgi:predicted ester cyclase